MFSVPSALSTSFIVLLDWDSQVGVGRSKQERSDSLAGKGVDRCKPNRTALILTTSLSTLCPSHKQPGLSPSASPHDPTSPGTFLWSLRLLQKTQGQGKAGEQLVWLWDLMRVTAPFCTSVSPESFCLVDGVQHCHLGPPPCCP